MNQQSVYPVYHQVYKPSEVEVLLESFVVDAEIVLLFLNHVHTVTVYVREIGANNLRLVYQSYLDSNHVLR